MDLVKKYNLFINNTYTNFISGHYMKPKRMHMVHNMVVNYGLYKKLDIVVRLNIHALEKN